MGLVPEYATFYQLNPRFKEIAVSMALKYVIGVMDREPFELPA